MHHGVMNAQATMPLQLDRPIESTRGFNGVPCMRLRNIALHHRDLGTDH